MDDVAREAGVSRALVSRAYRGTYGVSSETRSRILAAGEKLGYRPNRIASRLASKGGGTVGIFLLDLRNDVFADTFDGIREVLPGGENHTVLAIGDPDGASNEQALDSLVRSRVDIIIAVGLLASDRIVQELNSAVPVVSATRLIPDVDSAAPDDISGGVIATEHLLSLGHRRIVFMTSPLGDGYRGRQIGYEQTMRAAGADPEVRLTSARRELVDHDVELVLGEEEPPTAIIGRNDHTALGVLDALNRRGLDAPDDVSVIGFDNIPISSAPRTSLTTIDIGSRELGRAAARLALARLDEPGRAPDHIMTRPELVIRNSTGHPAR